MDEYEPHDDEDVFAAVDMEYRDGNYMIGSTALPSPASDAGGGDALTRFSVWYQGVHGYVCVLICVFGIVSNAMNIAVLTRRSMVIIASFITENGRGYYDRWCVMWMCVCVSTVKTYGFISIKFSGSTSYGTGTS